MWPACVMCHVACMCHVSCGMHVACGMWHVACGMHVRIECESPTGSYKQEAETSTGGRGTDTSGYETDDSAVPGTLVD